VEYPCSEVYCMDPAGQKKEQTDICSNAEAPQGLTERKTQKMIFSSEIFFLYWGLNSGPLP
jgi:hypothetical protein